MGDVVVLPDGTTGTIVGFTDDIDQGCRNPKAKGVIVRLIDGTYQSFTLAQIHKA